MGIIGSCVSAVGEYQLVQVGQEKTLEYMLYGDEYGKCNNPYPNRIYGVIMSVSTYTGDGETCNYMVLNIPVFNIRNTMETNASTASNQCFNNYMYKIDDSKSFFEPTSTTYMTSCNIRAVHYNGGYPGIVTLTVSGMNTSTISFGGSSSGSKYPTLQTYPYLLIK